MWFQPRRAQKVFTLFIEALDKLRAEAKCTTVCGRRINIFLYSPRTHFSSVKHVLIINLFNTHTASAGYNSHPPIQTDWHSCHCLSVLYRSGIWEDVFIFSFAVHRQNTAMHADIQYIDTHGQSCICTHSCKMDYAEGVKSWLWAYFPYSSLVNRPNGDCVN